MDHFIDGTVWKMIHLFSSQPTSICS